MYPDIDKKLEETYDLQRKKQKLASQLSSAEQSLRLERARLAEVEAVLKKENSDVTRLEGLSLAGLFYTILGSKEDQVEKERQEYLAAKLRYDQSSSAERALTQEVADLRRATESLGDVDSRLQMLLADKENRIRQAKDENARKLIQLSEELEISRAQAREIREAIHAGEAALSGLTRVESSLQSAENWGVWDVLGGGMLADMAKHSRLDDARSEVSQVQQLLGKFQRELSDVSGVQTNPIVEIGGFETFADTFFDSLIIDWVVQSKIQQSLKNTQTLYEQVDKVISGLKKSLGEVNTRVLDLSSQKANLIQNA